jgi:formate hydrogenlyase subunit 6/NADH:ubiquinone oxidoreductase subunit I
MVKITAIKEALKALFKPATTKYPHGPPSHVPPGIRGLPQFKDDSIHYPRCIFCGRCEDICPEDGIALSDKFELAADDKKEADVSIEFKLVRCKQCNAVVSTPEHLAKVERIMENIDPRIADEVAADLAKYENLCVECRRKLSYQLNTHTQKYYSRRWET